MGLRINNNIAALNAYRNLSVTDGQMRKSLEKLSSGFRINRAADDAAGLAISEGLRSQIGGLKVAVRNAQDGIWVVQTAEGALTETHAILQRMRDLAVQAANAGSQDTDAQAAAQTEFNQLQRRARPDRQHHDVRRPEAARRHVRLTNGIFQVGANNAADDQIDVDLSTAAHSAPAGSPASTRSASGSTRWTSPPRRARPRSTRSTRRSRASPPPAPTSVRTRTGSSTRSTTSTSPWRTCPRPRAGSVTRTWRRRWSTFTQNQILSQAGTAMLAQANQAPQSVLKLLQ